MVESLAVSALPALFLIVHYGGEALMRRRKIDPIVLAVGIFIAAVRHRIVLAEERHLRVVFGAEYEDYCRRVRQYL